MKRGLVPQTYSQVTSLYYSVTYIGYAACTCDSLLGLPYRDQTYHTAEHRTGNQHSYQLHLLSFLFQFDGAEFLLCMIHMFRYLSVTSNAPNLMVTPKLLLQSFTIVQSCLFTWSQLKDKVILLQKWSVNKQP